MLNKMDLNSRSLTLIFSPIVAVTAFNLLVEKLVLQSDTAKDFLFLRITETANSGIIGGIFSASAKPEFQISMVTLGFLLLMVLYFIQLFAPLRSGLMRFAISLYFGGVFANVVDRFLHGYVVDYLVFNFFGKTTSAFNFADLVQMAGVALIFALQFRPGTFESNKSDRLWVSKQFQKRYSYQLVTMGFFLVLAFGALSFMFLRTVLGELSVVAQIKDKFMYDFVIFYLGLAVSFLMVLFLVGKALSAHVVKPILNFEHYLRRLSKGDYGVFHVAEPEFNYLEQLSDGVRDHITSLHQEIQQLKHRAQASQRK